MDLHDKVAIVTGGNGGLGQRICHALADAGCRVGVVYAQSRDEAQQVADELGGDAKAAAFQCDVTDPAQVEALVSAVSAKFGRVDILVNDAAYNKWIPFNDLDGMTNEEWARMLDVNLTGPMMAIKAVVPEMRRQGGGRIVNISSVAGLGPQGSSIGCAVSKASLIHLTKCMAVALAPDIFVNCVAPGFLEGTRATANLSPEYRAQAAASSLLERAVDKDDVGRQVTEFCATDSVTGQTLVMDSGRVFH